MSFFVSEFVPHIEQLFDEDVLIGNGWTVNEALRPLAYSTLADFVHHVRSMLTLPNLSIAVQLFSKNVYDESLPISIQRMSCKVISCFYFTTKSLRSKLLVPLNIKYFLSFFICLTLWLLIWEVYLQCVFSKQPLKFYIENIINFLFHYEFLFQLLLNLVECIRQRSDESAVSRIEPFFYFDNDVICQLWSKFKCVSEFQSGVTKIKLNFLSLLIFIYLYI